MYLHFSFSYARVTIGIASERASALALRTERTYGAPYLRVTCREVPVEKAKYVDERAKEEEKKIIVRHLARAFYAESDK